MKVPKVIVQWAIFGRVGGGNLEPEGWEFEFQVERRGGFCLEAATSVGFAASMEEVAASVLGVGILGWL